VWYAQRFDRSALRRPVPTGQHATPVTLADLVTPSTAAGARHLRKPADTPLGLDDLAQYASGAAVTKS